MFSAHRAILAIAFATAAVTHLQVFAQQNLGPLASDAAAAITAPESATVRRPEGVLDRGEKEILASEVDLPTPESRAQKKSRAAVTEVPLARQLPLASETSTPHPN